MGGVLFAPIFEVEKRAPGKDPEMVGFPLVVVVLLIGGIFFTLYHRFLNFRGFKHAIDVVRGKYDNPDDPGEVSHFQALTAAPVRHGRPRQHRRGGGGGGGRRPRGRGLDDHRRALRDEREVP
jgi:hypothetical protein